MLTYLKWLKDSFEILKIANEFENLKKILILPVWKKPGASQF